MKMKKPLWVAVSVAVVGAALLTVYVDRLEAEVSGGAPVRVLMATQDIPIGATISQAMIGIHELPQSYVENRHVRASEAKRIIGVRASMAVRANESILWTDLATGGLERRSLSELVKPGMRAITTRADVTSSFGGLLRPGDRVDVLLSTTKGGGAFGEAGKSATITLLQNVLVLAAGGELGGPEALPHKTKPKPVNQVTLSVTQPQAQLLSLSQGAGRLTLVLRNPDDITVAEDMPETTRADILEEERRHRISRPRLKRPHREIERVD
ncbi:MAG: Flp pilus assembly protein CpaB [Myxococcota bacterium]